VNMDTLFIASDLLREDVLGQKPVSSIPAIGDVAKRLDFYLNFASDDTLIRLLALLQTGQPAGRAA
jgi:hypothetical protein